MNRYIDIIIEMKNNKKTIGQLIIDRRVFSQGKPYYCYYILSNIWKNNDYFEDETVFNKFKGSYQITGYVRENIFKSVNIREYLKKGLTYNTLREYSNKIDAGWAWPSSIKKITLFTTLIKYKKIEL